MSSLTQQEIVKRAEKIKEYHKLEPTGTERLHINRGRQLMYELLKDLFGDPFTAPGRPFKGDWEMLYTNTGAEAVAAAIAFQQQAVQQKAEDEQQRKLELGVLRLAQQTTAQVKAMLLDTGAGSFAMKKPGEISPEGLVRRLENEVGKGPTTPEGQQPFTWRTTLEQQGVAGLRAWIDYEMKLAEYQLGDFEEKPEKINFEMRITQNKIAYLKNALVHLPS